MKQPYQNRIVGYGNEAPDQLIPNERNARIHPKHQADALDGVLSDIGWIQDVIVNKRTSPAWGHNQGVETLVDGHLRVMVALRKGEPSIPVKYVDLSPSEENLALASFDPLSAAAAWDREKLDDLLRDVSTGDTAVQQLLADLAESVGIPSMQIAPGAGGDEFDVEQALDGDCRVSRGDIWTVGGVHRLCCGDSTDSATVARLVGGERARCMWTDPPYGVSYVGKTKDALTIENDGAENIDLLLKQAFAVADTALDEGAAIYVAHPPGALNVTFGNRFLGQGWRLHQTLIWVKDSMVLGHSDYHFQHEPIFFGYKPGVGRWGRGGQGWYGGDAQVSVFHVPRSKASKNHPTEKPVALVEATLRNSVRSNDTVYDGFGGSGPVLIAAHRQNCRSRLCELSPQYCEVILKRAEAEGLSVELTERLNAENL